MARRPANLTRGHTGQDMAPGTGRTTWKGGASGVKIFRNPRTNSRGAERNRPGQNWEKGRRGVWPWVLSHRRPPPRAGRGEPQTMEGPRIQNN